LKSENKKNVTLLACVGKMHMLLLNSTGFLPKNSLCCSGKNKTIFLLSCTKVLNIETTTASQKTAKSRFMKKNPPEKE